METNINDVPKESDIIPLMLEIAEAKGLKVIRFDNEDVKEYFTPASDIIGALVMAKNEDNARWNLQNLRHVYIVQLEQ